jgi:hypothetical protein
MSTPDTWPINYPARATGRSPLWTNRQVKNVIKWLEIGEEFRVIAKEENVYVDFGKGYPERRNLIRIQLQDEPDGTGGPYGFALSAYMAIGKTADMNTPMTLQTPPRPPPSTLVWDNRNATGPSTVFGKTVLGLVEQDYKQRGQMATYNHAMDDLNTAEKQAEVAHTIWKGYAVVQVEGSSLAEVLEKKDFHVNELKKIEEIHSEWRHSKLSDDANILYVEILSDFANEPDREDEMYGGRTCRPRQRKGEHVDAAEEVARLGNASQYGRSAHYRASATAQERRMVPLCVLPKDWKYTFLAEQILNQLFQLYSENVLSFGRNQRTAETGTAAAKYWIDSELAWMLQEIASKVFEKTGWPGALKRPATLAPFGSTVGLMWKSPIADAHNYQRTLYTRSRDGEYLLFRRSPLPKPRDLSVFGNKLLLDGATYRVPDGVLLHPVIELTVSGQAHPKPWACIPNCFGTNDVQLANSWALRLEWLEGTTWKAIYVQSVSMHPISGDKGRPCAFANYTKSIVINHRLRNTTFTPGPGLEFLRELLKKTSLLRAVVVETDWLTRTIQVSRFNEPPRAVTPANNPRLLTVAEVMEKYQAAALTDTYRYSENSPQKRQTCDLHIARGTLSPDCREDCMLCQKFNTLRTFTPTKSLKDSKLWAFLASAKAEHKVYNVPNPGLQTFDMELLPEHTEQETTEEA